MSAAASVSINRLSLSTAEKLVKDLSKMGGNNFRQRMDRINRLVQKAQIKVKKKIPTAVELLSSFSPTRLLRS